MPHFSIIVPVYNAEKYISQCVESLLNQGENDFEILLIDDGSADGSLAICQGYEKKDNRIKCIHQDNSGPSAARNHGLKLAAGDYCLFVDSDDFLPSDYLSVLKNMLTTNPGYLPVANIKRTASDYVVTKKTIADTNNNDSVELFEPQNFPKLTSKGVFNVIYNKLYDLALIREAGICFDEELNLGEDIIFNIDYIKKAKPLGFAYNHELFYYYRINNSSITASFRYDFYENTKYLYKQLFSLADDLDCDKTDLEELRQSYTCDILSVLRHNCRKDNPRSYKENQSLGEKIIQETDFKSGMKLCLASGRISGIKGYLYSSGSYPLIYLVERFYNLIRH